MDSTRPYNRFIPLSTVWLNIPAKNGGDFFVCFNIMILIDMDIFFKYICIYIYIYISKFIWATGARMRAVQVSA